MGWLSYAALPRKPGGGCGQEAVVLAEVPALRGELELPAKSAPQC